MPVLDRFEPKGGEDPAESYMETSHGKFNCAHILSAGSKHRCHEGRMIAPRLVYDLRKSSSGQCVREQQATPRPFWVRAALPVQSCRPGSPRCIPRRGSAFFLPWLRLPCQAVDERHIRLHCSAALLRRLLFLEWLFTLVLWRVRTFSLLLPSILQESLHLGVEAIEKH